MRLNNVVGVSATDSHNRTARDYFSGRKKKLRVTALHARATSKDAGHENCAPRGGI